MSDFEKLKEACRRIGTTCEFENEADFNAHKLALIVQARHEFARVLKENREAGLYFDPNLSSDRLIAALGLPPSPSHLLFCVVPIIGMTLSNLVWSVDIPSQLTAATNFLDGGAWSHPVPEKNRE